MVLLPGCDCCEPCGGDVCCKLAAKFMAATSLEIDLAGTDAQSIGYGTVKNVPACGYNIGSPYIVFAIFKGSDHTGTYSLAFEYQTGIDYYGRFARVYSFIISKPPYACGTRVEAYIELQRTFPPPSYILTIKLYKVWINVYINALRGHRRGSTSLPSFSGCDGVASTCLVSSETGGTVSYGGQAFGFLQGIFDCTDSFLLSSVQNSATLLINDYPVGYGGGGFLGDEKGYVATIDSQERSSNPTMSFSNLVIP